MDARLAREGRWQAIIAAAIALAVDALYLVIIWQEGEGELTSGRVLFVAACVASAAVALVWGLTVGDEARAILFVAAAAMLVVWTVLGAFSIGILLAPGAVFAALAAGRVGASRRVTVLAALGAVAVVAAGLALT